MFFMQKNKKEAGSVGNKTGFSAFSVKEMKKHGKAI